MKRFIRYLYEYEQEKRMRNVGFVKVEQGEEECMVHIHGKGLRMSGENRLQIYLIYVEDKGCVGIWQGEADNINPAVNKCLSYTRESVGVPENYSKINGVVLENDGGRRYAAIWEDTLVDVSRMRIWKPEEEDASADENSVQETEQGIVQETKQGTVRETEQGTVRETEQGIVQETEQGTVQETEQGIAQETAQEEKEGELSGDESEDTSLFEAIPAIRSEVFTIPEKKDDKGNKPEKVWRVRKIQRTELSKLARCEWKLANNNFLLHGYYNYHHLVFLESKGQLLLGVPGIYHEREAAAAGAFGFPDFIARDELEITLNPEECNEDVPFGYWCREVKRTFRWE